MEPERSPPMLATTREIVQALGGPSAVATWLACQASAVSNWHRTGIPSRHWLDIQKMAAELEVPGVTQEVLNAASEAARAEAANIPVQRGRPRKPTPSEAPHAQEAP